MSDLFTQINAAELVGRWIKAFIGDEATVGFQLPNDWTVDGKPAVTVVSDGTPSHGRATSAENVRIVVYAKYMPKAREIASRIDAFLLNPHMISGVSIKPGMGLLVAKDDDLRCWACAVTIVAEATKKGA